MQHLLFNIFGIKDSLVKTEENPLVHVSLCDSNQRYLADSKSNGLLGPQQDSQDPLSLQQFVIFEYI